MTPIREDKPGGDSVVYEPEFEQIRAEIAKIDSLTGETPDWNGVTNLGVTLLTSKAKDLTVAGYLVLGLFRTGGYASLVGGLDLCRELLTNFWETMYPEMSRMRGRAAALSWMDERVSAAITRTPPSTSDYETVKAAAESMKALYAVVNEKFGDAAPSIGDLRRSLDDALRISTPTAAPVAASAAAGSGGGAAPGAPATIDSPDAAYRVFRNAGNEIRRAAEYLIKQDPASPVPYLAQRGAAWSAIRELPADKDGMTQFSAPDANVPANWDKLMAAGEWKGLLEDTEWRLTASPFWIDINYYVALALENLGHEAAARVVTDQTVALVKRFPKLLELTYMDGRPFAEAATRQWVRSEMSSGGGGGEGGSAASAVEVDPVEEVGREARGMAARGRLAEAADLLQKRIAECGLPRERFRWRLMLARVCFDANQPAVAAAQLRLLDDEIEAHRLEAWEPGLALDALVSLYKCEKKLGGNGVGSKDGLTRLEGLYNRLCRLDVMTALSLDGKK